MASSTYVEYCPLVEDPKQSKHTQRAGSIDLQRKGQPRQMLSCTKCRERKVKCDRTKPCSACCARGHPKECEFIVCEGNEYGPIQQSYEIRKLRTENQRLKEKLQSLGITYPGDNSLDYGCELDCGTSRSPSKTSAHGQRRFKTIERTENIYFGSPGLATVITDFANLHVGGHSLAHTVPKGRDVYGLADSAYPFAILWAGGNASVEMARTLLGSRRDVFRYLDIFYKKAQGCYIPHMPDDATKEEFDRFLADVDTNAEKYPDMLALVLAAMAVGMQMSMFDLENSEWTAGSIKKTRSTSDVYVAASMQALRLASFLNSPTLPGVQTLIMIGPYLSNSGRFLDAYALFGTTIRLAHSIGLHRHPKFLDPVPPLREAMIRKALWWWMLSMDQQYSSTLGRPLGISGLGDCPPPEPLTTNPAALRLGELFDQFTLLARQILASDSMMNAKRIDEFTDKLMTLWDTMPEALQFNETWLRQDVDLPEWPAYIVSASLFAKLQALVILLNRQRVERSSDTADRLSPGREVSHTQPPGMSCGLASQVCAHDPLHRRSVRGNDLVVTCSIQVLHTFMFFHCRYPPALICWTTSQLAFSACMILLVDVWKTGNGQNRWLIEQALGVFSELESKGLHKLAKVAVQRIAHWIELIDSKRQDDLHKNPLGRDIKSTADQPNDAVMGDSDAFSSNDSETQVSGPSFYQPFGWGIAEGFNLTHLSGPPTPKFPTLQPHRGSFFPSHSNSERTISNNVPHSFHLWDWHAAADVCPLAEPPPIDSAQAAHSLGSYEWQRR